MKCGFTIKASDTVNEAVKILDEKGCSILVVLKNGKPLGVITERQILKKVILCCIDSKKIKVHQIMSKSFCFGNPEMELSDAARIMFYKKIDCLPIVHKEQLVGMIYLSDIIRCKDSMEKIKDFTEPIIPTEMEKAIDVYYTLDGIGKKCPLMVEQGYPKRCKKSECMWWIEQECAVTILSRKINNTKKDKLIKNYS
jgi:predicted transcriptional regulator